ncbi:hypothetical protein ACOSQ3_005652 [Xanthoceras sorbifolium]
MCWVGFPNARRVGDTCSPHKTQYYHCILFSGRDLQLHNKIKRKYHHEEEKTQRFSFALHRDSESIRGLGAHVKLFLSYIFSTDTALISIECREQGPTPTKVPQASKK